MREKYGHASFCSPPVYLSVCVAFYIHARFLFARLMFVLCFSETVLSAAQRRAFSAFPPPLLLSSCPPPIVSRHLTNGFWPASPPIWDSIPGIRDPGSPFIFDKNSIYCIIFTLQLAVRVGLLDCWIAGAIVSCPMSCGCWPQCRCRNNG